MQAREYEQDENGRIVSNGHDRHMGRIKAAKAAVLAAEEYHRNGTKNSNGMRHLGSGIERAGFATMADMARPAGGYCYKVGNRAANEAEYIACHALRAVEGSIAPPTRILYLDGACVLIMPLYRSDSDGISPPANARFRAVTRQHFIPDMHGGNRRATRDGHCRITDLGHVRYGGHIDDKPATIKRKRRYAKRDKDEPARDWSYRLPRRTSPRRPLG